MEIILVFLELFVAAFVVGFGFDAGKSLFARIFKKGR